MATTSCGRLWLKIAVGILCSSWLVLGQEPSFVLTGPTTPVAVGAVGRVWLCGLNDSSNSIPVLFQSSLTATLTASSVSTNVVLHLNDPTAPSVTIAPGQFVKREYTFDVPSNIHGRALLAASNFNPVVIPVESPAVPAAPPENLSARVNDGTFAGPFSSFFGRHIFPYEPIYFLLGNYPAAEFQLSLKYKVLNLDSAWDPLARFYFAYTQTSFWDLLSRDPSFYDTSYKPSAFLLYTNVNRGSWLQLDLQGGMEHESNGRGGTEERSLNTLYLQPTVRLELAPRLVLNFQPRVWEYLTIGHNNPDLPDYRGYADLRCSLDWLNADLEKRLELAARFRIGDTGEHAGWLVDLRWSLPQTWVFNPALDVQYFTGYGQTLRQYDQISYGLRCGLCLWY